MHSSSKPRHSFTKQNMNAAVAMRPNHYGHTVLSNEPSRGEPIDVIAVSDISHDVEFQPHIGPMGELIHNKSVMDSPAFKKFLENYTQQKHDNAVPEESPQEAPSSRLASSSSISTIDDYAKEFHNEEAPEQFDSEPRSEIKAKRTFASYSLTRFCTECGFSFNSEKFCPHCGRKRATYSAPNI